jgi:hypothetical protein
MSFRENEFDSFLDGIGVSAEKKKAYKNAAMKAVNYFEGEGLRLENAEVPQFENYIKYLMESGMNTEDNIIGVARYVYMLDMKSVWIYFASLIGGRTILPSIAERLSEVVDEKTRKGVFSNIKVPQLGAKPIEYCEAASSLMKEFEQRLSPEVYRKVLAGNHHKVSIKRFEEQKSWLKELNGDVDAWLKKMHEDIIRELEEYFIEDKVWFEQVITREVLDYVRGNQELLAGIREGQWIYNTKFPYAPQEYLEAKDPKMKRYYMCHCPLAREAVLSGEPEIPMDWCYCSAGYGKLRFDVAFGEETEAEVLESVLGGSDRCRFRFKIPESYSKLFG